MTGANVETTGKKWEQYSRKRRAETGRRMEEILCPRAFSLWEKMIMPMVVGGIKVGWNADFCIVNGMEDRVVHLLEAYAAQYKRNYFVYQCLGLKDLDEWLGTRLIKTEPFCCCLWIFMEKYGYKKAAKKMKQLGIDYSTCSECEQEVCD